MKATNKTYFTDKDIAKAKRLFKNGVPRYIRCYIDYSSLDCYTVVFTGHYSKNKTGRKYWVLGSSINPFSPTGIGSLQEQYNIIDRPTYSHLGKKVDFTALSLKAQEFVIQSYLNIWGLPGLYTFLYDSISIPTKVIGLSFPSKVIVFKF